MRAFASSALACALLLLAACGEETPAVREGVPAGPYRLTLAFEPADPQPGATTQVTLTLTRTATGEPVRDLQIVHERALHTFIVARDFSAFAHLHQEDFAPAGAAPDARGRFTFPYVFPHAGPYRILSEFTHRDRTWTQQFEFDVGTFEPLASPQIDLARERDVEGYRARLGVAPVQPVAGHEAELVLELSRGDAPVTDLQLLLGAEVHVASWRSDGAHFGHTHSYTPQMAAMMRDMAGHPGGHSAAMMLKMMSAPTTLVYPGPRIPIRITFPEPGIYHLFLQCAPGGRSVVFPFQVEVAAYREGMPTAFESIVPDA